MPGAQVLVAKSGHVIYHRAFGYHTYAKRKPVQLHDLYDLASITKVAATTLGAMRMSETGKIDVHAPIGAYFKDSTYLPGTHLYLDTIPFASPLISDSTSYDLAGGAMVGDTVPISDSMAVVARVIRARGEAQVSPVFDVPIRKLLTHHSGLPPSLPVGSYLRSLSSRLYSPVADEVYDVPVAKHLFLNHHYLDSLWNDAKGLRPDTNRYVYSCVNMIMVQQAIDSLNGGPLASYLDSSLYGPLGLQTLGFNPKDRVGQDRLIPTSEDRWRGQLLCGTVHDPTAALLGGVSGNAGLFSNVNDLAILGQMLLQKGRYGGRRYFQPETVAEFTARREGHRALGWDMPLSHADYLVAPSASPQTFGHTGFTGTCFWVDPEHDLVFIFLSNRVHPSQDNQRINQMKIRQRVHQVVYDALGIPPRFKEIPVLRPIIEPEMLLADQGSPEADLAEVTPVEQALD